MFEDSVKRAIYDSKHVVATRRTETGMYNTYKLFGCYYEGHEIILALTTYELSRYLKEGWTDKCESENVILRDEFGTYHVNVMVNDSKRHLRMTKSIFNDRISYRIQILETACQNLKEEVRIMILEDILPTERYGNVGVWREVICCGVTVFHYHTIGGSGDLFYEPTNRILSSNYLITNQRELKARIRLTELLEETTLKIKYIDIETKALVRVLTKGVTALADNF